MLGKEKAEESGKDIEKFLNSFTEQIIALKIRLLKLEQTQYRND